MTRPESEQFLSPYRDAVRRHGAGFEATLWGSREAQANRFDVMVDMAPLDGCRILDVGCGPGDFAARLLARAVPFAHCHGIDAMPEVVAHARERDLERCTFDVVDILGDGAFADLPAFDFACFSGTLNTMDDRAAQAAVRAAWETAAQGVIFNFLSDRPHPRWREKDLTPARRFDTVAWLDWALGLSSRVAFTQAYLDGHDATILVLRD